MASLIVDALNDGIMLNDNLRIHSSKICGVYVFWTDDLTPINRMRERLAEALRSISEENTLLQYENETKEEQAHYDTKNRIYYEYIFMLSPLL